MKRLSNLDEEKARKALLKCAAETKDIDDNAVLQDKAYSILKEAGLSPNLIKRACESYNSNKSIYRLSAATSDTRGDNFALLDAPAMYKRATQDNTNSGLLKAASAIGINKINFRTIKQTAPIKKVASAVTKKEEAPIRKLSNAEIRKDYIEMLDDMEQSVIRSNILYKRASENFDTQRKRFISAMATELPAVRKEAAELLHKVYGIAGKRLIDMFNNERPLSKVASYSKNRFKGTPVLPKTQLYKLASDVIAASENVHNMKARRDLTLNLAYDNVKDMYETMKKDASVLTKPIGGNDFAKTIIGVNLLDKLNENMGLNDINETEVRAKLNTANLVNKIKEHGTRRAFMNIVNDDTVSKYPLDDIVKAYNAALTELPLNMRDVPPTAHTALIKARVLARLGRGNVPSQSDADVVFNTMNAFSRTNTDKGQIVNGQSKGR